uniref:Putative FBD-associated F-box protein n=1 Tax=Noccaea caerulescens TaxID=107243 RepID=A0A1J3H5R3_NOCCA
MDNFDQVSVSRNFNFVMQIKQKQDTMVVGRCNADYQACSKKLREKLEEEDTISELPDPLICQILYHLPTKEAVKTSALSTRWRNLWLCVHSLDLASRDFPNFNAFVSFSDSLFDYNRVSCIYRVKLSLEEHDDKHKIKHVQVASYLKSWIDSAVKHKIKHVHVRCPPEFYYEMPSSLYRCETLVSLELYKMNMVNAEFVSLPRLETMALEDCWYPNESTFERLVSCCPVLEELKIDIAWNDTKVFKVQSRSLKRLALVRLSPFKFGSVSGVVVDAPLLCSLSINDHVSESFRVNSLRSRAKLDVSLFFGLRGFDEESVSPRRNSIQSFLSGVSSVREMKICPRTFKIIYEYSKLEPLPRFDCVSRVCVTLCVSNLEWLSSFLESCPNLKSLILDWNGYSKKMRMDKMSEISFESVPRCLLSSLEFVDIKSTILGYATELEVVRYLLESSTILKKLTLRLHYHAIQDDFVKKLGQIQRRSLACQVVFTGLENTVANMSSLSFTMKTRGKKEN